jgi:hypothetical protein
MVPKMEAAGVGPWPTRKKHEFQMKISFKKANRALLIVQISALLIALFMIVKAMKMLFAVLPGANTP